MMSRIAETRGWSEERIRKLAGMNLLRLIHACDTQNCFEDVPSRRADLGMFRGSENPVVKCKGCHGDMDTMLAYVGERVGLEIERRPDPDH